jgi:hypothetical protein
MHVAPSGFCPLAPSLRMGAPEKRRATAKSKITNNSNGNSNNNNNNNGDSLTVGVEPR